MQPLRGLPAPPALPEIFEEVAELVDGGVVLSDRLCLGLTFDERRSSDLPRDQVTMLGHLSFGVSDLARSAEFYDRILASLGYVRVWTNPRGVGFGEKGGGDKLALFAQPDRVLVPGPGFHLAFTAPSREAVHAFHAEALRAGGRDVGAPGPRPQYGVSYYAAFVLDPDGYKLEAVHQ